MDKITDHNTKYTSVSTEPTIYPIEISKICMKIECIINKEIKSTIDINM